MSSRKDARGIGKVERWSEHEAQRSTAQRQLVVVVPPRSSVYSYVSIRLLVYVTVRLLACNGHLLLDCSVIQAISNTLPGPDHLTSLNNGHPIMNITHTKSLYPQQKFPVFLKTLSANSLREDVGMLVLRPEVLNR